MPYVLPSPRSGAVGSVKGYPLKGSPLKASEEGSYKGSCQNYGPFLGTLNNRCRIITGTQKRTIILTTTHKGSTRVLQDVPSKGSWGQGSIRVLRGVRAEDV